MPVAGIDIFAGAGGLSEGFIQAGFHIIGTVEKDRWACETQRMRHIFYNLKKIKELDEYWTYCRETTSPELIDSNRDKIYRKHPGLREKIANTIWQAEFGNPDSELGTYSSKDIIKLLEKSAIFHKSDIKFILGGPPCQVYSIIGRSRMGDAARYDRRNFLFKFYFDIVNHFKPEFFLFENVPGIISAGNGRIFNMIAEHFDRIGYRFISGKFNDLNKNVLMASDFGVPQNRKRFIFIGIRNEMTIEYPEFNFDPVEKKLTTRDAIDDLPFLKYGQGMDNGMLPYERDSCLSAYQVEMRHESSGVMNHRARPVNRWYDRKIYRIAITMAGKGDLLDYSMLPDELKKHRNDRHFKDRFRVHCWDRTPHTIVSHIAKDGHYNIHPDIRQLRSLTVREAARIQSFPDNFRFEGLRTSQYIQVGNAVPPKMAKAFADALKKK